MTHPIARRAAADLATIRQHWGDLLLAIETPPADVWPPRQLSHTMRPDDEQLVVDRAPLVLRSHPAPLNLEALDAGIAVERMLFELCDTLAAAVQRATLDDSRRWTFATHRGPGSRAHGLHWAAVWAEGRLLDEDIEPERRGEQLVAAPFAATPEHLLREGADTAERAAGRVLRVLGLDHRSTPIGRRCPWCHVGELTLHTTPDGPPTLTCPTGPSCPAPVALDDQGRRRWEWPALLNLGRTLRQQATAA